MQLTVGSRSFDQNRKTVLLIGAGAQSRREYALSAIAAEYNLLLIDDQEITWQAGHAVVACPIAALTEPALTDTAAVLAADYQIDGILTFADYALEETADLARLLELPYTTTDSVRASRDKHLTRKLLASAGVGSPQSWVVHTLEEARWVAGYLGYPVVLKPRNLGGSAGVRKVLSADEVEAAYMAATAARDYGYTKLDGILVEEMLVGPEISVETATVAAVTQVVAVTRKETGFDPHFVEVGHLVDGTDELAAADSVVSHIAAAAIEALGITAGVCHVEIILTAAGPRIVEVNARLAGDLIPYLVERACGRDLSLIAAQIAVGDEVASGRAGLCAAIRFFHPSRSGVLERRELSEQVRSANWLDRVEWMTPVGALVTLPPDGPPTRIGFGIVTGADPAQCAGHLRSMASGLRVETSPA